MKGSDERLTDKDFTEEQYEVHSGAQLCMEKIPLKREFQ